MCRELGVVLQQSESSFSNITWGQFVYPDGSVCYDYLTLKTGSDNPPEPYFPFKACTLNNSVMGQIWVDAVLHHKKTTVTLETAAGQGGGSSAAYQCTLSSTKVVQHR